MSAATSTAIQIPAGTWTPDAAHSRIGFSVKHMGVSTVRGEFREYDATIEISEDPADSRAYGTIQAASINTNQSQRDEHLRSEDFFGAEQNPELRFESKRVEAIDDDSFRVVGDLTMNGVTNEVELTAEVTGSDIGPEGEERIGLEATGQVSRRAYQMKFNAALGSGNAVVGDKVKLDLDLSLIKSS